MRIKPSPNMPNLKKMTINNKSIFIDLNKTSIFIDLNKTMASGHETKVGGGGM
jgi:hypothetical protein